MNHEKWIYHPIVGHDVNIALIYPNTYYLGMSSLGFHSIYYELGQRTDTCVRRQFIDVEGKRVRGQEGKRVKGQGGNERVGQPPYDLRAFDILAFSLSFEADYCNVLKLLKWANIPPYANARSHPENRDQRGEEFPLVIAGGISVTYNPEPLADFVDVFVIGEAENNIHPMIDVYRAWRSRRDAQRKPSRSSRHAQKEHCPPVLCPDARDGFAEMASRGKKRELLQQLAQLDGMYVPSLYEVEYQSDDTIHSIQIRNPKSEIRNPKPPRVIAGTIPHLDTVRTSSTILTEHTAFADTYLIEIARGCGRHCRFCIADYARRPPRYRSLESIQELASEAVGYTNRVGLVGAAVSDHPQIDEIAQQLVTSGFRISCASLRIDTVRPPLLDALAESEQHTITLAPEVATERLQKVINKTIAYEQLYHVVEEALKRDIFNIRLYFMIGVPSETQADVEAIIDVLRTLRTIRLPYARKRRRMGVLKCTISPFIPKPHTPFQWCPMEDVKTIRSKLAFLKRHLNQLGGVKMSSASARLAHIEGLISRGDRRLGRVIHDVALDGLPWNKALRKHGLDSHFYTQRTIALDEILPWSHIDLGVNTQYLQSEYIQSEKGSVTSPCQRRIISGNNISVMDSCKRCGACR